MSNINFTSANVVVLGSSKNINRISDFVHGANGKQYVAVRDENDVETRCSVASIIKTINNEMSRLSMTVAKDNLSLMTSFINEMTDMFTACKFYIEFNEYDKNITYFPASRTPLHPSSEIIVIDCKLGACYRFSESNAYDHYKLAIKTAKTFVKAKQDRHMIYEMNQTFVRAFYDETVNVETKTDNIDFNLEDALNTVLSA